MAGLLVRGSHEARGLDFALSKPKSIFDSVARVVILLSLAVAVLLTGLLFMFIFVPIVVAYIWDDHDKIKAIEARLSKLEKPAEGTTPERT